MYLYITPSSPTVANTAAFIKSKKQQSFSRQLAAELSWVLVLAGLVWCTATSAHLGGATVATSVVRLRVKPRHHRCGYTLRSRSHVSGIVLTFQTSWNTAYMSACWPRPGYRQPQSLSWRCPPAGPWWCGGSPWPRSRVLQYFHQCSTTKWIILHFSWL